MSATVRIGVPLRGTVLARVVGFQGLKPLAIHGEPRWGSGWGTVFVGGDQSIGPGAFGTARGGGEAGWKRCQVLGTYRETAGCKGCQYLSLDLCY